jgi:hypothetical protein
MIHMNHRRKRAAQDSTSEGLYPESMRFTVFAVSLIDEGSGGVRLALMVLSAAVVLLLLLTCANIAARLRQFLRQIQPPRLRPPVGVKPSG